MERLALEKVALGARARVSWELSLISRFKAKSDFIVFGIVVGVFILVAAQGLGDVPVPQTDEAYTLQVPYEMLNRGQLSLPMYRYLGGNIENVWHSYTPVYFVLLSGFLKLFGWGLLQGRAFNLVTAVLTLLMTYSIGRRLFNWRAGMIAVMLLAADQTFFERSRLLRNDFAAASFAMLAFYLYEEAESKQRGFIYVAAGLAAGAGVMCHTNAIYMIVAIGLLMLIARGWRVLRDRRLYQFTLAALAVMAYEVVYDIIDYKNFALQNRGDELHFGLLERGGWLRNLASEADRYLSWTAGGAEFAGVPRTTLHVFQVLAAAAILYLAIFSIRRLKAGEAVKQPAVRLLIVTLFSVGFHAAITSHKEIYYMAHLAPWFALCAGVMLSTGIESLPAWARARSLRAAVTAAMAVAVVVFGIQLAREYRGYLSVLRDPEHASFQELKDVLREIVPDGVCPVAMKAPAMWLAFPEHDRCFASIERRMMDNVDIAGKEYAVLLPVSSNKNRIDSARELNASYPALAELNDTPYGDLRVYYTGASPQLRAGPEQRIFFFGRRRGHVSAAQIALGREVWSRGSTRQPMAADETGLPIDDNGGLLIPPEKSRDPIAIWMIDLESPGIYQLSVDAKSTAGRWIFSIVDSSTDTMLHQEIISGRPEQHTIQGLFKIAGASRVRILEQAIGNRTAEPLRISRVSIHEIPSD